ncbi:hypothetical protein HPB50_018611 [Hyalomma asiaticum]|uniref:Uncharacterized protein n=1 Tax=Hyalomma asiaticum TaxID=266040 RepID=A0ACB7SFX3_HYAAI|nr:hypothetical protein HPB50_018611 [Hyalomma asiaticum]
MKSRKALKGHNFVTSGLREPWVKKVAAYTVIVVTQVNHSQSVDKPPVEVCTANALGANTCSAVARTDEIVVGVSFLNAAYATAKPPTLRQLLRLPALV